MPALDGDEVLAMVGRARTAQPAWAALSFAERTRLLRRSFRWLYGRGERL